MIDAPAPNFEQMLEELADSYPQLGEKALELKDDVIGLMDEDAEPNEIPELDLEDAPEEEEDLNLEL